MDVKGDSEAIVSLVCSIIGIFTLGLPMGIIAVVSGLIALSKAEIPHVRNKATIGLVIGIIEVMMMVSVINTLF